MPVGDNSNSYTTPPLSATTSYWVRVTNAHGNADTYSAIITIPGAIPTLNEWGMIMVSLLFALAGVVHIRRRKV